MLQSTNDDVAVASSVQVNPVNTFQVFVAHADGTVRLWDYDDAVVLKVNYRDI
jgi:hypothetical protein